jgi:hypothetical protein
MDELNVLKDIVTRARQNTQNDPAALRFADDLMTYFRQMEQQYRGQPVRFNHEFYQTIILFRDDPNVTMTEISRINREIRQRQQQPQQPQAQQRPPPDQEYEDYRIDIENDNTDPHVRSIPSFDAFYTRKKPTKTMRYPEREMIDGKKCFDFIDQYYYDINAFLRGEEMIPYDKDSQPMLSEKVDAVSKEEARDRLVFFVYQGTNNGRMEFQPFCYYRSHFEQMGLETSLFYQCDDKREPYHFEDPLLLVALPNFYIRVSDLVNALETKKQVFMLLPSNEYQEKTFSLINIAPIYQSHVSAAFCQNGTSKHVFHLVVCEGDGDNLCYPIIDSNEIHAKPNKAYTSAELALKQRNRNRVINKIEYSNCHNVYIPQLKEAYNIEDIHNYTNDRCDHLRSQPLTMRR